MSKKHALDIMFAPRSVAVIGAAQPAPGGFNTGQLFVEAIRVSGFKGPVYPVNRRPGEVDGLPIYPSLAEIPGPVDYVISCIPASGVIDLMHECAEKSVKALCLFTAGFSETGSAHGRQMEVQISNAVRATGVHVLGPNCMGVYSPKAGLSFTPDFPRESGGVSLICQSGGNTLYLVRAAGERGIRFNKVVSYGNATDIDESDLFEYLAEDEETTMVAAYIEGVQDGRRFSEVLTRLARVKPVAILKPGQTPEGRSAASSHTGSLAGSREIWQSLMQQSGAVEAFTLDELVDMMVTFTYMKVPQGKNALVLGNGGGASVLATDACAAAGFKLPALPEEIKRQLRNAMGEAGTILTNPLDIMPALADDEAYRRLLRTVYQWDGVDLIVLQIPLRGMMLALPLAAFLFDSQVNNAVRVGQETGKAHAVVVHYLTSWESCQAASDLRRKCHEAGVAVYGSVQSAAKAIAAMMRYYEARKPA